MYTLIGKYDVDNYARAHIGLHTYPHTDSYYCTQDIHMHTLHFMHIRIHIFIRTAPTTYTYTHTWNHSQRGTSSLRIQQAISDDFYCQICISSPPHDQVWWMQFFHHLQRDSMYVICNHLHYNTKFGDCPCWVWGVKFTFPPPPPHKHARTHTHTHTQTDGICQCNTFLSSEVQNISLRLACIALLLDLILCGLFLTRCLKCN